MKKNNKALFKDLALYLKKHRLSLLISLGLAIVSTVFVILGPKILGSATTEIAKGMFSKASGNAGINFTKIAHILIILLGMYLLSSMASYLQNVLMAKITISLSYDIRKDVSQKVNKLPINYFDKTSKGDILSRMSNDVDTLSQSLNSLLSQVITSVVGVIGVIIMMLSISWLLCLIAVLVIPFSIISAKIVARFSQRYFRSQQQNLGALNGNIEEIYGGLSDVKALNGNVVAIKKFDELNEKLYDSAHKSQFIASILNPITQFLGNFSYVLVCLVGGFLAIHNEFNLFGFHLIGMLISIGDIQAFIQYVRSLNQPVAQLAQVNNMMQSSVAAMERLFEFLNAPIESDDGVVLNDHDLDAIKGSVTFEDVSFGYLPNKTIINDFNLKVNPCETIAIVGPTGAGKTTLVKLLMRFYELNSGNIKIDDYDISKISRESLHEICSMVLQDAWLFSGSIKDNLCYGKKDASMEEIKKACKLANIDHFIETLDGGYDALINEDTTNISSGQRQLLTIARAFLVDPKILILDEATSNVDTLSEKLVQEAMDKLMVERTAFVIAHRLSTIKNADKIIVINHGEIVEVGTHDSLLAKNGFYASLYNSQFAGCE